MDNLTVGELKELIVFYKDKSSNLEFEFLTQKLAIMRNSKLVEQLNSQITMLNSALEEKKIAEVEVVKKKTTTKSTKTK